MSTFTFTIVTCVIATVHGLCDVFLERYKVAVKIVKFLSLVLIACSFYSAYLTQKDDYASKIEDEQNQKKQLLLENKILSLNSELIKVNRELATEKNRIKSIAMIISIDIDGAWAPGSEPYSTKFIPIPLQDRALVFAIPKQNVARSILSFFPSNFYHFVPLGQNGFRFNSTLALRGDANILGAKKNTIFLFDQYRISVPMLLWQNNPIPLRVHNIKIQMTVNDSEEYSLEYPANLYMWPTPPSADFNDKSSSFLEFIVKVKRSDFKISKK